MDCLICCSSLLNLEQDVATTSCGHVFHLNCVTSWIMKSNSCPSCRSVITESQLIKTYLPVSRECLAQFLLEEDLQHKDSIIRSLRTANSVLKEKHEKQLDLLSKRIRRQESRCKTFTGLKKDITKIQGQYRTLIVTQKTKKEQ